MWKQVLGAMALVTGVGVMPVEARDTKPGDLTLERVFASPDLAGTTPRALKLSPDGKYVTLLRNRAEERERFDLWAMDTATGEWRMLVDSRKVGSGAEISEAEKMQRERARIGDTRGIVAYDWAPDGRALLVPLDGDLYLASLDGGVVKLGAEAGQRLNAEISPKGGYASYVNDRRLVLLDLTDRGRGGAVTPVEESPTVHWGEAEFVAQEEMGRSTGYWWSPDDRRIAVQRFDEAPVGIVSRTAIGAETTQVFNQRYPKAGTPNVLVDLYVMNPDGLARVKVDLGSDPDIYLARVDWSPDGKTLFVQRQNRAQTVLDMLAVDPDTGKSRILFSEKAGPKSWINLSNAYRVLNGGNMIWWSERDGHGHLYRLNGGKWMQLTKGAWEVADLTGVDEKTGRITFTGNRDGVLERHLYTLDLARPGTVKRISEAGYWNTANANSDASRIIVTRSKGDQPPQVMLIDGAGKRLAWVNENAVAGDHPYAPFAASHRAKQFGTITAADGTPLHWEMITPKLEPGKRYPVFFHHYGGPHSQQVSKAWGGALQQYLVDRGYIWFALDNRGAANRGKAFEDHLFQAMGGVEVEDQLAGAAYLKTLEFVDAGKVTTYGWSYGGYMTLKLLQAAPGTFAAGVAGAPVSKWELYDTHYTERYMGDPQRVQAAYDKANTVADAVRIGDPLLLIHGMADDNVVLEHSTVMMARMQAGAVPFETMLYPGQTHRVAGPGISAHLWKTILDFLDRGIAKGAAAK